MRILFFTIMFAVASTAYAQGTVSAGDLLMAQGNPTDFESAYSKGFHIGYCQAKSDESIGMGYMDCIVIAPIPPAGRDTYSQGVIDGSRAYKIEKEKGSSSGGLGEGDLAFLLYGKPSNGEAITSAAEAFNSGLIAGAQSGSTNQYVRLETLVPVVEIVINDMPNALPKAKYLVLEEVDGSTKYFNKLTAEGVIQALFSSDKTVISLVKPKTAQKLPMAKAAIENPDEYLFIHVNTDYLPGITLGQSGNVIYQSKDIWRSVYVRNAAGKLVYKARFLNINSNIRYKHLIDPDFSFPRFN